ncbi:transcriptional regulation of mitochondrial recombination-domain-containing protein [Cladorrhinum sp. PSN332]|nr:transcriptional regulation of mitochondrial recombination-domain-containing protein [Cladorrhinum sp. PSN332]
MNAFTLNPARVVAAAAVPTKTTTRITASLLNRFAFGGLPAAPFSTTPELQKKKYHHPRNVKRHEQDKGHPTGHGEKIWIYNHIVANHVVFSFTPDLRTNKALRQFPYTGKKLVPTTLRKDYWRPMAVVEFARGKGNVGRSVYAKCRELKKRHELEWEDESLLNMSREERGKELGDMRGEVVADLAHVLGGNGKGNRVLIEARQKKEKEADGKKELEDVTVYWASEQDRYFAKEWTGNVTHVVGLPPREWVKMFGAPTEQSEGAMLGEEANGENPVDEGAEKEEKVVA